MEDNCRMSLPILFDKKNNNWFSLGFGPLTDAMNSKVARERNGIYTLSFNYPINGSLFHELKVGRWVVADAGPTDVAKSQRFEIAKITKPIKGIVTVYCEHYRYKLLRSIVKVGTVYKNIPAQTALNMLRAHMEPKSDFTFYSNVGTWSSIDFTDPNRFKNAQEVLGGVAGSILDNFGGEYLFNNNQVRLLSKAGKETNIVIAYGKNLTDINQEESIENTYTSVYGWAKVGNGDEEKVITLPEVYIDSEYVGNYTERRIQMVDFSDKEPKDVASLRKMAQTYIKSNAIGVPKISIKASFVDLASSVMDDQLKNLEILDLCDWVTIAFNQLNIHTTAQIVKTVWNVALDQYESIELGEARTDFAKVIEESKTNTDKIDSKIDWLEKAQKEASDIIKNPGKGHVVIYPSLADPQEWLLMDTTNINTARKVWRWNIDGLGFSSTGYNGTYELAMTNNGAIVADRITAGTLRAINIIGVAITGSTFETKNGLYRTLLKGGDLTTYYDGKKFIVLDGSSLKIYQNNGVNQLGGISRMEDVETKKQSMSFACERGNYITLSSKLTNGIYQRELTLDGSTGEITVTNLTLSGNINGKDRTLKDIYIRGLKVPNHAPINFYSDLNMNGYSIRNQSDIRLKEHIKVTAIDGIKETKKLNFVEFNRKQNYQTKDPKEQPSNKRELGLIAQYTPFLSVQDEESHYLSLDMNKQVMLNSLTNKQLIEKIEQLEDKINKSNKNRRKYHRGGI